MAETLIRYSKSSQGLARHKVGMYEDNIELLARNRGIADAYRALPARIICKNCAALLPAEADFVSHGIAYCLCPGCGHLNGMHEESAAFCDFLYVDDSGKDYARNYDARDLEAYANRVRDIYAPKASFLREALSHHGIDHQTIAVTDIGAGSGYFVAALMRQGFARAVGYEVSPAQVSLGNRMLDTQPMRGFQAAHTSELIMSLDTRVVSMIGVLEHLLYPREALAALRDNPNIEYLFLSLPLFSPSVAIEAAFPKVFNRHLGGAHTHLYTRESIDHFATEFGFKSVAEWWFGLDIMDLFRSLHVTLTDDPAGRWLAEYLANTLGRQIDALQEAVDVTQRCSEVHILLRKSITGPLEA